MKRFIRVSLCVIGGMVLFALTLLLLLGLLFRSIGPEETVLSSIPSPSGRYIAEIVDSNQGALGGNTYVEVKKASPPFPLFRLGRSSVRVYTGRWKESVTVRWKDDDTLLVNDTEYELSGYTF